MSRVLRCALALGLCLSLGCSSEDDPNGNSSGTDSGSPDQVGAVCEAPADCYPGIDPAELSGEVECLDRVVGGYCTHQCGADEDCCAVEGECTTEFPQVCSPFESTGMMMCFLSCEPEDVMAAGAEDDQQFCQTEAHHSFICRSSGGGANNRKICVPGDCGVGAACAGDTDCAADLACETAFGGGYCGVRDCASDADCPADSLCVDNGDFTYCARTCAGDTDCGFCRPAGVAGSCTSNVTYVGAGGSDVCVVPS